MGNEFPLIAVSAAVSGEVRKVPAKEKKLIRGQALFAVLKRSSQFSMMAVGLEAARCGCFAIIVKSAFDSV